MEASELLENTKVVVTNDAPFHRGRVGFVAFYGCGPSTSTLVLRDADCSRVLFAVNPVHVRETT